VWGCFLVLLGGSVLVTGLVFLCLVVCGFAVWGGGGGFPPPQKKPLVKKKKNKNEGSN